MRILVVNWQDRENPQAGGAEIHLHEIFGRLVRLGHEVTLLVSGFSGAPGRAEVDGMQVHRVGRRFSFTFLAPEYFWRRLGHRSLDLVVEDLNKVPLFMPFWTRTQVVLLVHHLFGTTAFQEAPFPLGLATWLLERPIPWVYRTAPAVAVSQSTASDLRRRGLTETEIAVVPNGVDLNRFRPLEPADPFLEPTLLYLGRLKRYKRVDLVIRAVARLRDQGTTCRLLVAGKGDHEGRLVELRNDLGLQGQVEFRGFVEDQEKTRLLQRSWIHVLTSPKEGWGIANLEAAACGTPTVASDSPGLRDSVLHDETGVLVPHGDIDALSETIGSLLKDRERRVAMGTAARRFAERFSWDESARAMEEFLELRVAEVSRQK
ncbi:glycosyltransferase family 4 protein [Gemmatimonadota bacterium]